MNGSSCALTVEGLARLLDGIDAAMQSHLDWNQRLLRYALLGRPAQDDMVRPRAHELCHFGLWFGQEHPQLIKLDSRLTEAIGHAHQAMHDGVRDLCAARLAGEYMEDALQRYEAGQGSMVSALAELKHCIEGITGNIDGLTGLPLRHGLSAMFAQCRRDARRENRRCYLAVLDIDHFKRVNDRFGHLIGDAALKHVAAVLRTTLRESDPLIRFGGEEFVALLRSEDDAAVQLTTERLLEALRNSPLPLHLHSLAEAPLHLSVSVGLTEIGCDEDLMAVLARADQAMLTGKRQGRDRQLLAPMPSGLLGS